MKVSTLGFRLEKALKDKHMSKTQLSNITGIPKSSITQYCNNEVNPRMDKVKMISDALNINEVYLMGYDVDEKGNATSKYNDVRANNDDVRFLNMAIGEALEMVRVKNNKTIPEIAELLGRKVDTILAFESGEDLVPSITVMRICHLLNYDIGEFYKDVMFFYKKLRSNKKSSDN